MREVLGTHDALQRLCQYARRQRAQLASVLGVRSGSNRAFAIAGDDARQIGLPPTPRAAKPLIVSRWRPINGIDADAALSAIT